MRGSSKRINPVKQSAFGGGADIWMERETGFAGDR